MNRSEPVRRPFCFLNETLKTAVLDTIPVMTGYPVHGFGFGMILKANGFDRLLAQAMSVLHLRRAMQSVAGTVCYMILVQAVF